MSARAPIVAASRVAISPGHVERRVGDQVFVLTPDSVMHILDNATGVHVWQTLTGAGEEGLSALDLARALREVFAVAEADALRDTCDFLEELRAKGVILTLS